ncbi:MAG: PAS domain S-box protein, partial [Proteobacteria bacterium]|nr:PAS domain S-box protein [Pseudomonadota bacterium]
MRGRTVFYLAGLTLLSVFLLWVGWEFVVGDLVGHLFWSGFEEGSPQTHWKFVITGTSLAGIALIIPTLVSLRSITGRKRAERALEDSEEKFGNLVEGALPGILIHRHHKPLFVNRAWAEIHGYALEEVMAMESVLPHIAPSDRARLIGYKEARLKGQSTPSEYEYKAVKKDGSTIHLVNHVRVVRWGGQPAIQTTVIDISERKRAEEALRESELRLKAIMNNAAVEITLKDLDGRFLMVNRTYEANHGLRQDELIGKTLEDISSPEAAAVFTALERKVVETGEVIQQEVRPIRAPGVDLFLTTKFPIRNSKDEIVAVGTINTDISELGRTQDMLRQARDGLELRVRERTKELAEEVAERARAEEAVWESGERYRRIYENTPAMLHSIDKDGRLLSVSDHWLEVLGYERGEVIGSQVTDFMTEYSARYLTANVRPAFMKTGRATDLPFQFVKKDGAVVDVLLSAVAERDEAGNYMRSLTVLTDITERKRAENALRESEERYRRIYENTPVMLHSINRDGRLLSVSDHWLKVLGYRRDEVIGEKVIGFMTEDSARATAGIGLRELKTVGR